MGLLLGGVGLLGAGALFFFVAYVLPVAFVATIAGDEAAIIAGILLPAAVIWKVRSVRRERRLAEQRRRKRGRQVREEFVVAAAQHVSELASRSLPRRRGKRRPGRSRAGEARNGNILVLSEQRDEDRPHTGLKEQR